jgi:hypothetical protein
MRSRERERLSDVGVDRRRSLGVRRSIVEGKINDGFTWIGRKDENLLNPKDTKIFWMPKNTKTCSLPKIQKPFGCYKDTDTFGPKLIRKPDLYITHLHYSTFHIFYFPIR